MSNDKYQCPLCRSVLTKERWTKITGQWEEQQKFVAETKKQIQAIKKEKEEQDKKHKQEKKKLSKAALETGFKKGQEKEKKEREKMSKLLENQAKANKKSHERIAQLEKQLKEGKTPQTAGFDYEKEVIKILGETFSKDNIIPTGKKGDALQEVISQDKVIGSILYECKKTSEYNNEFITKIKQHQEKAKADYGVIVTHAIKKGKSKFFIEDEIIVIDPLCLLDIAYLLRSAIIEMHKLKLTRVKMEEKGRAILQYMQSGEFKTNMIDSAQKAEEAYKLMIQEINDHKKNWTKRYKLYFTINNNIQTVRLKIGKIIIGNPELGNESIKFPELPENL